MTMELKEIIALIFKPDDSKKTNYFKEEISINGFLNFCRANMLLIAAITFAVFCTYGIKLWFYSIGIDTELVMAGYGSGGTNTGATMGRWGGDILGKFFGLFQIKEMNPWLAYFLGFCLFWLVVIEWCYFINIFSNKQGVNDSLIPFAVVSATMQVLAAFLMQLPRILGYVNQPAVLYGRF